MGGSAAYEFSLQEEIFVGAFLDNQTVVIWQNSVIQNKFRLPIFCQ